MIVDDTLQMALGVYFGYRRCLLESYSMGRAVASPRPGYVGAESSRQVGWNIDRRVYPYFW